VIYLSIVANVYASNTGREQTSHLPLVRITI